MKYLWWTWITMTTPNEPFSHAHFRRVVHILPLSAAVAIACISTKCLKLSKSRPSKARIFRFSWMMPIFSPVFLIITLALVSGHQYLLRSPLKVWVSRTAPQWLQANCPAVCSSIMMGSATCWLIKFVKWLWNTKWWEDCPYHMAMEEKTNYQNVRHGHGRLATCTLATEFCQK